MLRLSGALAMASIFTSPILAQNHGGGHHGGGGHHHGGVSHHHHTTGYNHHHHHHSNYYPGGTSVITGTTGYAATNSVPYQGAGLILVNPRRNSGPVTFAVDGQSYTLQPGYQLAFDTQPSYTVAFNRGGNLGDTSYQVNDGRKYAFNVAPGQGWDLFEQTGTIADTSASPTTVANAIPSTNAIPTTSSSFAKTAAQAIPNDADADVAPAGVTRPAANYPAVRKGDLVVLTATVDVKSGAQTLATVQRGQSLKVLDVRGTWVLVDVGQPEYGWIHRRTIRLSDSADVAPGGVARNKS